MLSKLACGPVGGSHGSGSLQWCCPGFPCAAGVADPPKQFHGLKPIGGARPTPLSSARAGAGATMAAMAASMVAGAKRMLGVPAERGICVALLRAGRFAGMIGRGVNRRELRARVREFQEGPIMRA